MENRFNLNLNDPMPLYAQLALLVPCSTVVAKALQIYLTEMLPAAQESFVADQAFTHADAQKLNFTLTHLLRAERYFDFYVSRDKALTFEKAQAKSE